MLSGYLWDFARSVLALLGALGLGFLALRAFGKHSAGRSHGPLEIVQRVALEPRKSLYVVRAGARTFLIGCGDGAAPTLLAELAADTAVPATSPLSPGEAP